MVYGIPPRNFIMFLVDGFASYPTQLHEEYVKITGKSIGTAGGVSFMPFQLLKKLIASSLIIPFVRQIEKSPNRFLQYLIGFW